jgi:hypothetical protein
MTFITIHLILDYWTAYKYKNHNIIFIRAINMDYSFDSQCFEIITRSKRKNFLKLELTNLDRTQKVTLPPLLDVKYSFFDNTWSTRFYIQAFPDGRIRIILDKATESEDFFSLSLYKQKDRINWFVSSMRNVNYRKIPLGKRARCTILMGFQHNNEVCNLWCTCSQDWK